MKNFFAILLALCLVLSLAACGETTASGASVFPSEPADQAPGTAPQPESEEPSMTEPESAMEQTAPPYQPTEGELAQRAAIEQTLNLKNNPEATWTYASTSDSWALSPVAAVVNPVLPEKQGVSVCIPGAYVLGLDTDGDGQADVTATDGTYQGALVIDYEAQVISDNGQIYTASTAPVIFTTGAAGYGSQSNSIASSTYVSQGYISMSCGNRGKQDSVTDEAGNVLYYTGDAPSCLTDQKAAARYVKYNILLGNLPGSTEHFVTTGGSGGAAHSTMFAATSNNPDFYDYQIEAGAVGVYQNSDGSYSTAVTIDGKSVEISDGAWGCVSYSAITSLAQGDMAQAFEYYMDTGYQFNTPFQAQLAEYLSQSYMDYVNNQNFTAVEAQLGFDLNGDGDREDTIPLTIEYDLELYPETNGYGGTYLDLYLCEFTENLQWYLDNLSYAEGWTWFDEAGAPLSHEAVAAMTGEEKAQAFLTGRYTKSSAGGMGGPPDGGPPGDLPLALFGAGIRDGGPMAGSTASSGGGTDSSSYLTFDEMAQAYHSDIAEIQAGDRFGKNIVELYDPSNYIGAQGTQNPTWARVVMGAIEGDMPMLTSLNLQLQWLSAGTDAVIEWQWDGGHVPSESLGESLPLYVDMMYGKHESGTETRKPEPEHQTTNGTAEEASGTDLSSWVSYQEGQVSFTLADVLAYRNTGAMKAVPGFDVIDYGQEDYVFGSEEANARHWNPILDEIFQDPQRAQVLSPLFNAE